MPVIDAELHHAVIVVSSVCLALCCGHGFVISTSVYTCRDSFSSKSTQSLNRIHSLNRNKCC